MNDEDIRGGIWARLRGFLEPESASGLAALVGAGMVPGVGTALDVADVAAGIEDRDPSRVGLGLLAAGIPFMSRSGIAALSRLPGVISDSIRRLPKNIERAVEAARYAPPPGIADDIIMDTRRSVNDSLFNYGKNVDGLRSPRPGDIGDFDYALANNSRMYNSIPEGFINDDVLSSIEESLVDLKNRALTQSDDIVARPSVRRTASAFDVEEVINLNKIRKDRGMPELPLIDYRAYPKKYAEAYIDNIESHMRSKNWSESAIRSQVERARKIWSKDLNPGT